MDTARPRKTNTLRKMQIALLEYAKKEKQKIV
jgi:hypothetical protein